MTDALDLRGRRYDYAGPAEHFASAASGGRGTAITSMIEAEKWLAGRDPGERDEPFTFVVDLVGFLRLAPRRSEHVGCAGGEQVLSAGEIAFTCRADGLAATQISNQSTGYCPDQASWPAVAAALERAGLSHPGGFTDTHIFRRCPRCRQINVVKDDHYVCAVCDETLPVRWNVDI
jgi:hypothetical protein